MPPSTIKIILNQINDIIGLMWILTLTKSAFSGINKDQDTGMWTTEYEG